MKKLSFVLFFFTSVFCEKQAELPRYLPSTHVDDVVENFLSNQDSLEKIKKVSQNRLIRDILGRLSKDTSIYVMKEVFLEKKLPVGIIDLTPRKKQSEFALEIQRNQNGDIFIYLNGKPISLEEYHKIVRATEVLKKDPFIRHDTLTAQEIKSLISGPKPVHVFYEKKVSIKYDEVNYPYSVIFGFTGVNGMHSVGAKGSGVGLFFEEGCPFSSVLNENYFIQSGDCLNPDMHATWGAKLLQLTAPEAMVVNFVKSGSNVVNSIVELNGNRFNPPLEIGSYAWHIDGTVCSNAIYCYGDEELDEHIYNDRLIYFIAAGNMSNVGDDVFVGSPGKALNAITVGAVSPNTDEYFNRSKWKNSEIGNQKPEIANYTDFNLGSLGNFNGTSASTIYSAAIAANVLSRDSNLKRHPEIIKSMFLMNATIPIGNAATHDSDDWFSVASKLPYFSINESFRYRSWSGPNAYFFNDNEEILFVESGISYGQHCRAAISWLTSGLYAGEYKMLAQDIDLYVYQGTTEPIASSTSAYNPFEVVDFTTQSSSNLTFKIKRFANSYSDDVVLGFTMKCDNE